MREHPVELGLAHSFHVSRHLRVRPLLAFERRRLKMYLLIVYVIHSLALMCLAWTCLESPRWLMQNGRSEEAYQWLVKYHGNGVSRCL